jgi:hypothetical protein
MRVYMREEDPVGFFRVIHVVPNDVQESPSALWLSMRWDYELIPAPFDWVRFNFCM